MTGDDKEAAKINRQQRENRMQGDLIAGLAGADLAKAAEKLHAMPEDTLAEMKAKAEAFENFRAGQGWHARKPACDLYVAAFLRKKEFRPEGGCAVATPPTALPQVYDFAQEGMVDATGIEPVTPSV